ncbi:MAG: thymidine phosphorylase, partial [Myxococcales bacterium]
MRAYDLIKKKRDGGVLEPEELRFLALGAASGEVADEQLAAFLMAVFFRGLDGVSELPHFLEAMLRSGRVLDLSHIPGRKVDKHSTGGVGDKISLPLAPLVAACGVRVPMVSGRGLGHTGGTLDKLESIPGFRVALPLSRFVELVETVGACLIGQTDEIAPADRKLYALRDVTATVESLPLIAASIMSKKMAEGIDALVLDVKTGDGAFMKSFEDSKALAQAMVDIGRGMGKKVAALITDMEQPLGRAVGNAVEIQECVETLKGRGPQDLEILSVELAAWMLQLGGVTQSLEAARKKVREALDSGAGLRRFQQCIELQHGDPRVCDSADYLPKAAETIPVPADRDGRVTKIACRAVGQAAMLLGAGRETVDSQIDPAVGLVLHKKVGDLVVAGEPLLTLHVNDRLRLDEATAMLRQSIQIGPEAPAVAPLVKTILS